MGGPAGHGDSDGCNHLAEGPDGHEGTVTVVVSDWSWKCTVTHLGTNTGEGQTPTCVRKWRFRIGGT